VHFADYLLMAVEKHLSRWFYAYAHQYSPPILLIKTK